jgi:succinate-acetate transporter protein
MSDPTSPGDPAAPPADDDDAADSNPNVALGIVFGMLGVVLMLTLDDTRVAGLPFLILGITFFVMGIRPATRKRDRAAADDDPPRSA